MKIRTIINIATILLLAIVIFFSREQLIKAWDLLGSVNIAVFLLLAPLQFFSYYSNGEIMFSYLKSKGNLKTTSRLRMARIALELNFVNHIIPVPSVAGFTYLNWILKRDGVNVSRSTMAQILRYALTFVSFMIMIIISVIVLSFDGMVNRTVLVICSMFAVTTVFVGVSAIYAISSKSRLKKIAANLIKITNKIILFFSFGLKKSKLTATKLEKFLIELHDDYVEIRRDIKLLKKPLLWSIINNILDVSLIFVAFLALGFFVNPASLFVAYGISAFVAIFAATPGGSGAYEAAMITFLVTTGISPEVAIAGTLLARATLFISTILFGYIFYQSTINKYGRINKSNNL